MAGASTKTRLTVVPRAAVSGPVVSKQLAAASFTRFIAKAIAAELVKELAEKGRG